MIATNIAETWDDDMEGLLERIRLNCMLQKKANTKLYMSQKKRLARYKIPVIIISGFNSVLSVGFNRYIEQHTISLTTCMLSLLVGVIGSIQLYLKMEETLEITQTSAREYYQLAIDIHKVLSLERHNRSQGGRDTVDDIYNRYTSITEKAILHRQGKQQDALLKQPTTDALPIRRFSLPFHAPSSTDVSSLDVVI
jgi:hypothetical protein